MRINLGRKMQSEPGRISQPDFKSAAAFGEPLPDTRQHLGRLAEKESGFLVPGNQMPDRKENDQHQSLPETQVLITRIDCFPHGCSAFPSASRATRMSDSIIRYFFLRFFCVFPAFFLRFSCV